MTWLKTIPEKLGDVGAWQLSQAALTGMCLTDLAKAPRGLFWAWQVAHSLGVPLNISLRWQVSQRTV